MDFKTKIDKLLKVKKLPLWKLAAEAALDSTLRKAYKENREMRPTTTWKFLETMGISEQWWTTGQGDIFIFQGSYAVPQVPQVPPPEMWVHRQAYEQLEANLLETKARLDEAQAKINELNKLHAQHNEQMKQMLALARSLAGKQGGGGHLPDG